nr:MAG TPA: hypothetical protein [Caudoviricetes sp.]
MMAYTIRNLHIKMVLGLQRIFKKIMVVEQYKDGCM